MMYQVGQCTFQLTTSRRGRRCNRCGRRVPTGISTHDLTKRSTTQKQQQQICRAFQLTTSRRGRRWISSPRLQQEHFNSRPHEEVDPVVAATCEIAVSFQLTTSRRGRPGARSYIFWCRVISTHDLTKRSTCRTAYTCGHGLYFNSRPHEEVDRLTSDPEIRYTHFNSRPHEEVDVSLVTFDP